MRPNHPGYYPPPAPYSGYQTQQPYQTYQQPYPAPTPYNPKNSYTQPAYGYATQQQYGPPQTPGVYAPQAIAQAFASVPNYGPPPALTNSAPVPVYNTPLYATTPGPYPPALNPQPQYTAPPQNPQGQYIPPQNTLHMSYQPQTTYASYQPMQGAPLVNSAQMHSTAQSPYRPSNYLAKTSVPNSASKAKPLVNSSSLSNQSPSLYGPPPRPPIAQLSTPQLLGSTSQPKSTPVSLGKVSNNQFKSSTEQIIMPVKREPGKIVLSRWQKGNTFFIDDINFEHLRGMPSPIDSFSFDDIKKKLVEGIQVTRIKPKTHNTVKLCLPPKSIDELVLKHSSKTSSIHLMDVGELRQGRKTTVFEQHDIEYSSCNDKNVMDPALSFSLVTSNNSLDIVAPDSETWNLLVYGIIMLIEALKKEELLRVYFRRYWTLLGSKSCYPTKEIALLLKEFNIHSNETTDSRLENVSVATRVDFNGFMKLLTELRERQEIKALFMRYAGKPESNNMTLDQFLDFLHSDQKEKLTREQAKSLMKFVARQDKETDSDPEMSYAQFESFLTSDLNDAFDSTHDIMSHDMSRPLNHYFIASSHNTYLEGNQLSGTSSIDMYIRVLKTGCRCIELDTWDGSENMPIILHGHTLTTKIKFRDVVIAIRDYGFYASSYPLILSIENHCCVQQQQEMANILKSELGEMLAVPYWHNHEISNNPLPSPESLQFKVLLKGKTLYSKSHNSEEKSGIAEELSNLTYLSTENFDGFDKPRYPWQMSSFNEVKKKELPNVDLLKYNMSYITRVYPAGTRVASTNYNPWPWWNAGCQMVALNYQTPGKSMWCNEARFKLNGGTGYLMKPQEFFNPFDSEGEVLPRFPNSKIKEITVDVLSVRQLPPLHQGGIIRKGKTAIHVAKMFTEKKFMEKWKQMNNQNKLLSPCVQLRMFGLATDTKTYKTSSSPLNGYNPSWAQKFSFKLTMSELAVLVFVIINDDPLQTKLAYYCIPVEAIRPGYRVLPLRRLDGYQIPLCNLFCHFDIVYAEPDSSTETPKQTVALDPAPGVSPASPKKSLPTIIRTKMMKTDSFKNVAD